MSTLKRYRVAWDRTGQCYVMAKSAAEALTIARRTGLSLTRDAHAEEISDHAYAKSCQRAGFQVTFPDLVEPRKGGRK